MKKLSPKHKRFIFGKRELLQTLFSDKSKFIITFSETHKTSTKSELFKIPGFQFIHKDRENGEGGGVAMYLSDDIKWKRRLDFERGRN